MLPNRSRPVPWLVAFSIFFIFLQATSQVAKAKNDKKSSKVLDDDEQRLINYLFGGEYNREVRPVRNKSIPVTVTIDLAYTQLVELDAKNQVLVSNSWIRLYWFNHLLTWDRKDFGGIKSINVDPKKVWLPDIVLFNNADETLASGQMDQFKTKVILTYDGNNSWYSPTILRSRCAIDIEYFPFDDQTCIMKFTSWTYDGLRVDLQNRSAVADLKSYLPSGEFEMISAKAIRNVTKYSCCPEPYPYIEFSINIRRKTLFYFNNLIVPCFLITALGLLTFVLPPATGERVTLVITTLLAMTVFMLMIAENTPTTSEVTPLIGKFFIASMVIIGLSLIATCIVLNLYECSDSVESAPDWVRHLVVEILAPFLRVDPPKERPQIEFTTNSKREIDTVVLRKDPKTEIICLPQKGYADKHAPAGHGVNWSSQRQNYDNETSTSTRQRPHTIPEKLAEGIAILGERARNQEKIDAMTEEWQVVAKVADRFFLLVFLLTIAVTTAYIFLNRPRYDD
eukprot:gene12869-14194_t